jgi:ribosome-associated toxin RatA of RatAB toxin-antitoxin module
MAEAAREQIEVSASPARCFALATAFEAYPEWTSDVKQVSVLARDADGRGRRVEYHVAGLGRRVRYVLDYDFADAPRSFSWSLVEGDMLRALDGRYAFTPTEGGTHVDYTLRVDLAVPMPGLVKRRASGMIMGNALRDLKRAVEQDAVVDGDEPGEAGPAGGAGQAGGAGGAGGAAVEHDMADDEATPAPGTAAPDAPEPPDAPEQVVPHPDAVPYEEAGTEARPLPPPSILESVLTELLGAVPEVKDHVLEAADALLDAAKALVDAADRVVRQQRGEE